MICYQFGADGDPGTLCQFNYQVSALTTASYQLCTVCGVRCRGQGDSTRHDSTVSLLWLCCVVTFVMVSNNQIGTFSRCIVVMYCWSDEKTRSEPLIGCRVSAEPLIGRECPGD